MDCTRCTTKYCRSCEPCNAAQLDRDTILQNYHDDETQRIVQAAAKLVDYGRAGTLNRLEEIVEFSRHTGYKHLGLAYCYGLETLAKDIMQYLRENGFRTTTVSCTAGSMRQNELNQKSNLPGVSCNPLSQATILNREGPDLAIVIGLCMGHDILFTREYRGNQTTLLVKDRTRNLDVF